MMERKRLLSVAVVLIIGIVAMASVFALVMTKKNKNRNNRGSMSQQETGGASGATTSSFDAVEEDQSNIFDKPPGKTGQPTDSPFDFTDSPTFAPTTAPRRTRPPSTPPTAQPSKEPTPRPSKEPTPEPTESPITRFYAIADVPYNATEIAALPLQIAGLPDDAEFLIHLGDIRSADQGAACTSRQFDEVASMLRQSRVPVFLVVGGALMDWIRPTSIEWNGLAACLRLPACLCSYHDLSHVSYLQIMNGTTAQTLTMLLLVGMTRLDTLKIIGIMALTSTDKRNERKTFPFSTKGLCSLGLI